MKKILLALGVLVGLVVLGVGSVLGYASYKVGKKYDIPPPKIVRATSPEAIARGEEIFRSVCGECHAGPGGSRPIGVLLREFPPALGTFYSANLTSHPEAGIGAWKDENLAQVIISSIGPDGRMRAMPYFRTMGDEDVAAVIGFMRSGHPDFAPYPERPPSTQLAVPGKLVVTFAMGITETPRTSVIPVPPRGPTAEYGKYLAHSVYDCLGCHTAGFAGADKKALDPAAFGGGFEYDMTMMGGEGKLYSSNLTPDETAGIGKWSLDDFKRALREGVAPGGVVRPPMPRYRYMSDLDMEAIFTYLKTLAPNPKPVPPSTMLRAKADPSSAPEMTFTSLGCATCHGANKPFADKLKSAVGKPVEEVARWIRNPESFRPGTPMPTYASLVDEKQAIELATWIQQKGGTP